MRDCVLVSLCFTVDESGNVGCKDEWMTLD